MLGIDAKLSKMIRLPSSSCTTLEMKRTDHWAIPVNVQATKSHKENAYGDGLCGWVGKGPLINLTLYYDPSYCLNRDCCHGSLSKPYPKPWLHPSLSPLSHDHKPLPYPSSSPPTFSSSPSISCIILHCCPVVLSACVVTPLFLSLTLCP